MTWLKRSILEAMACRILIPVTSVAAEKEETVKRSLALAAALALALPLAALAQAYPGRPITLVVPYTPGTGIDIIARTVGPKLSERWGQPVVVDTKPRASANLHAPLPPQAPPPR